MVGLHVTRAHAAQQGGLSEQLSSNNSMTFG